MKQSQVWGGGKVQSHSGRTGEKDIIPDGKREGRITIGGTHLPKKVRRTGSGKEQKSN